MRTSTPARSAAPVAWTPPDPETYGVTRRQFLNRSVFALMGLVITQVSSRVSPAETGRRTRRIWGEPFTAKEG